MPLRNARERVRRHALLAAATAALLCAGLASPAMATTPSHYGVEISKKPTQNMAFSNGVYSATADGAMLNVHDLESVLASGNVEVTTGNGSGGDEKGDLHIDAALTWVNTTTLTLDAYHSIFVTQPIADAGTGALTLTTNDGGSGGIFNYGPNGSIAIWNLTNVLTIDGAVYTLVGDIHTLASAIAAKPAGFYALANPYDAKKDGT